MRRLLMWFSFFRAVSCRRGKKRGNRCTLLDQEIQASSIVAHPRIENYLWLSLVIDMLNAVAFTGIQTEHNIQSRSVRRKLSSWGGNEGYPSKLEALRVR